MVPEIAVQVLGFESRKVMDTFILPGKIQKHRHNLTQINSGRLCRLQGSQKMEIKETPNS